MPSAAEAIRAAIVAAGGAIRFDRFMALALYGEGGFYTSGGRAGRRGDFITSPEVGPLFGTVLARWIHAEFRRLGSPCDFTVVEAGAGPGTLARAVRLSGNWRYVAVDVSAAQRGLHPAGVESVEAMPGEPIIGVVVANELLDNLPFRLAVFDDGWREAWVSESGDGRFAEVLRPFDLVPPQLPERAELGARCPVQQAAGEWVRAATDLVARGSVLCIDYCTAVTAELAGVAWRQWLRTYAGHERGQHYLAVPGEQDITAQVCLDQLTEPEAVRTQAQFLQRWGISDLVDEGRREWTAAAARPDLRAMRMRSRVAESEALLDPDGLGGFTVCEWRH